MSDTELEEEVEEKEEEEQIEEDSSSQEEGEERDNPLDMSDDAIEKLSIEEYISEERKEQEIDTKVVDESESDESEEEKEDTVQEKEQENAAAGQRTEETAELDYKSEYEKLLSPFKANGKDIQVDNVDDALTLMQMGANYNKKMASLKPNLKLLKMLENNELLDETKLNYLIDLSKKSPDAIQKLLKDSEYDPLEQDVDEEKEYQPKNYAASEQQIDLDTVLGEIKHTPTYAKTINAISNDWDDKSKQVLIETPAIIATLNDHMGSGIYDQIVSVIEKEKMLGRLNGLSDIEAYKQVGDAIQAQGGFGSGTEQSPQANVEAQPKVNGTSNPKVKAQKRAASSTKSTAGSKKAKKDFNPLSMSDEEFEKISASKYM